MAEWQRISETIVGEIEKGLLEPEERLPADRDLAARFGVHRHTVRRALADLQLRGFVRSERGRGTFIVGDAIAYRLGTQARFEENLARNNLEASRRLLSFAEFGAPEQVASELAIEPGRPVLMAKLMGEADSTPVHLFKVWFALERTPGIYDVFRSIPINEPVHLSMYDLMKKAGVPIFQRKSARLSCRLPDPEEARILKMSPREPVFEAEITNIDRDGSPVYHGSTCYCGSRTVFVFDYDDNNHRKS